MAPTLLPEVFLIIFSYFQKADLKPSRLVGRMFNDLIIPFLFDKIYISPQYLNLAVFRSISQSPHLAKHVKELVYDATEFTNDMDEATYDFEIVLQAGRSRQPTVPCIQSDTGYRSYQQFAMDQEKLISSEEDFTHLCTGLRLMPNITRVVVKDFWDVENVDGLISGVPGPLSRACNFLMLQPNSPWTPPSNPSRTARARSHRVFLTLNRALSTGNYKIHNLTYSAKEARFCLPLHTFCLSETDLQHTVNVFQHLRKITFSLCIHRGRVSKRSFGNLAQALSAAVKLEALDLGFGTYGERTQNPLPLLFGEETTWQCLKHLVLRDLRVDAGELMNFFRRHRTSLRHIELSSVRIRGRFWEEVYDSMQDCLHLVRFGTEEPIYFDLEDGHGVEATLVQKFTSGAL